MTAGTAQGEAQESCARGIDHVVEFVLTLHEGQVDVGAFNLIVGARDEIGGAGRVAKNVAGNLFFDELVIGFVCVE